MESEFKLIAILLGVQAFLYGTAKLLESFKDKTKSEVDNKAHKAISYLLTGIDIVTGNREHEEHIKK